MSKKSKIKPTAVVKQADKKLPPLRMADIEKEAQEMANEMADDIAKHGPMRLTCGPYPKDDDVFYLGGGVTAKRIEVASDPVLYKRWQRYMRLSGHAFQAALKRLSKSRKKSRNAKPKVA